MNRERESSRIRHPEDVACGGGGARRKRSPLLRNALACSGALLLLLAGACSRDWDAYDPRGDGASSTGTGGAGGMGGASGSTGGPIMCEPGATFTCYGAAEETAGVGPCKKGTAICAPSGTSYGACVGQVLPVSEICNSAEATDDDCDGAVNDHCAVWSKKFSGSGSQQGFGVAVDNLGNVLVAGHMEGTVDFGGGPRTSAGEIDVFVAKFDGAGNHVWSRVFGSAGADGANGVAVDGDGNVLVAGFYGGAMTIDGMMIEAPADAQDAFVVKLAPDSKFVWSEQFRSASETFCTGVAVDGAGNVAVTGAFKGAMTAPIPATPADTKRDGFVVRLDAGKANVWAKTFGSTSDDEGLAVALDATGNMFLTGYFNNKINFGSGDRPGGEHDDVFVAKFGPTNQEIYVTVFPSPADEQAQTIAVAADGSVVVGGYHSDGELAATNFGKKPLPNPKGTNAFVLGLNPAGEYAWSETFGDASEQTARSVAIDATGSVFIAGRASGTINLGGLPLTGGTDDNDVYVAKLAPGGMHVWSRRFGDAANQSPRTLALSKTGKLYMTGEFLGTIDFGKGPLNGPTSGPDIFLVQLAP